METKNTIMTLILHNSVFLPLSNGHGGEKRTYQILFDLQEKGYSLQEVNFSKSKRIYIRSLFSAFILLMRVYGITHWKSPKAFLKFLITTAYQYDQLVSSFRNSDADFFLWESVRPERYLLLYLAQKYGKKVIACPHNVESLVPLQNSSLFRFSKKQAFEWEMNVLKACEQVYAISHEETWLLSLWGVKAKCYLYKPVGEILSQMQTLRLQREHAIDKNNYLLLGTAINEPTRWGMQHIIDLWIEHNVPYSLHIGGYGTEKLSIPQGEKQILFMGEMTDTQLQNEQIHAKALLIYQPPTTGALTRISEALAVGIPIIANDAAARSYHNISNVYVYHDDVELLEIISKNNL